MYNENVGSGLFINLLPLFVFLRSNGLERTETHDAKARFIGDVLTLFSQGEAGLTVFDILYTRYYFWEKVNYKFYTLAYYCATLYYFHFNRNFDSIR